MTDPLLDRDALALAGQLEAARPGVHRWATGSARTT